jgi:hypothetical protein
MHNFLKCKNILLIFVSIIPIIILFSINHIDYAHGQTNGTTTQTLVQQNPGVIELQPPINTQTGQKIELQGTAVIIKDPVTGQLIVEEAKLQPLEIHYPSLSSAINQEPLLNANLGLLSTVPNSPFGNSGTAFGVTTTGQCSNIIGLDSSIKPRLTDSDYVPGPTFNPPLKKCDTNATGIEGGFDIAEYVITGEFDKDKLKGDDFAFDIFADLVGGDQAESNGDDAPYKANILTDNNKEKTKVKLDEIATVCIDVQNIVNIKKDQEIGLNKSALVKSLDY